jgi:flagellin
LLDTSLTRLSTGLKINSGRDNPAGLVASETLRSEISTIEQAIKNSNRATNVIATADTALGEISGLLNQIRGLVQEGLNTGALSTEEIEANQLQIDAALSAINRISANTTFAGAKLIDGSKAFTTESTAIDAAKFDDFQINEALFGGTATIAIQATVTAVAEKGLLHYNGNSLTQATTLEVAGSKGSQVLFLGASSSLTDIRDAIEGVSDVTGVNATITAASANFENNATANTYAIQNDAVAGTASITSAGANNDLTFTDRRATSTQGVFEESVSIEFIDTGVASEALAVNVVTDANGNNTIEVTLGNDGNGDVNSTATAILTAIQGDVAANALVTVVATGSGGVSVANASVAPVLLQGGIDAETITFTDARTTTLEGTDTTLGGSITLDLVDDGNSTALGVNSVTTDVNGDTTIEINLEHDANGVIQTSVDELIALVNADPNVSNSIVASGEGGDLNFANAAIGSNALAGGADGYDITFTDARSTPTGDITVIFSDPGASSQALAFDVSTDTNGDVFVTFFLATDGAGAITTTGANLETEIANNSALSDVIAIAELGDGVVQADTGIEIGTEGTLVLQTANFGSEEFVQVNVLSGLFATTLDDNTTNAARNAGTNIQTIINGQLAQGRGLRASVLSSSLNVSLTFAAASNVLNESATITVTGGGSLFQIGQEVSSAGQIGLGIQAVNTARLGGVSGKLFELGSGGGKSVVDVSPTTPGSGLVAIIEESISKVANLRGRLGALQKNVIETNITTLGVAFENISEARSQIIDTDFAAETANLTKAQILSQAGISVLAIANQNPSQVLSLLG